MMNSVWALTEKEQCVYWKARARARLCNPGSSRINNPQRSRMKDPLNTLITIIVMMSDKQTQMDLQGL